MDRSGNTILSEGNFDVAETYSVIRCWNPSRQFVTDPEIFIDNNWSIRDLKTNTNYTINFVEEMPATKTYKSTSNMLIINATKSSQTQSVVRT